MIEKKPRQGDYGLHLERRRDPLQLEDIHTSWAGLLGITEPQWLILMAITELDEGRGVAGIDIANKLRVHPAFVINQTKSLEKGGLLVAEPGSRRRALQS